MPTATVVTPAGARTRGRVRDRVRELPAVLFVCAYVTLLLGVPSQLVFAPLGSPGTPANLLGVAALAWWGLSTVAGVNPVRGLTSARLGAGLIAVAVLGAYAGGMASGRYSPPHLRFGIADWTLVAPTVHDVTVVMDRAADRGLISAAGWLGVLLLVAEGLRSWTDLERVIDWLVWLAAFVAALGIVQYYTSVDIASYFVIPGLSPNSEFGAVSSRSVVNRVSSTAVHPIEYGVVLAAVFPLVLHRTIFRWRERLAWLPAVLVGAGLFLSVSRSAVITALVAGLVLVLGWPRGWRIRALWIAPLAVMGLRVALPGLLGTIYALFVNLDNDPSVDGRTADYVAVSALWAEHRSFGRGLFTFLPQYFRILDNQYLMLLMEVGLVGLCLFVVAFLIGLLDAIGAHRRAASEEHRHAALAIAAGIVGILVSFATFDTMALPMSAGLLFLLLGLAGAVWRLSVAEAAP